MEGPPNRSEESAGARLTDRATQLLHSLHRSGDKGIAWVQVLAIVVPILVAVWMATSVTMGRLQESAAVTDSRLEAMNLILVKLEGGQKSNSDEVIRLRGEVQRLTTDLNRLREDTVTDDRLKIETVERKALEKRMTDLYHGANTSLQRNTGRIETLRTYHNKKE